MWKPLVELLLYYGDLLRALRCRLVLTDMTNVAYNFAITCHWALWLFYIWTIQAQKISFGYRVTFWRLIIYFKKRTILHENTFFCPEPHRPGAVALLAPWSLHHCYLVIKYICPSRISKFFLLLLNQFTPKLYTPFSLKSSK